MAGFGDRRRAREAGRRGAAVRWAKARAANKPLAPFTGTIIDMMTAAGLVGPTWAAWTAFLKATFGLPLDPPELDTYTKLTGRTLQCLAPMKSVYSICGRRSGKTRIAALVALYVAIRRDYVHLLAPGEMALIPVLAVDKDQAQQGFAYIRGLLARDAFKPYVTKLKADRVDLKTGCAISVKAASMRTTRGFSMPAIIADELAHWRSDESTEPDVEILRALLPSTLAMPDPLLLGLSTPYAKTGALYAAWDEFYGKDGDTLVWQAPTVAMNQTVDQKRIAQELERDPDANSAEYLAIFRSDVASFLDAAAVEKVINRSRPLELPHQVGIHYTAFADVSGGSVDSATIGIAHQDKGSVVLDVVREWRAPHVPEVVVTEMCDLLKSRHIRTVVGDHYSAGWVRDAFGRRGVEYRVSLRTKSELYLDVLPLINSAQCELPNLARLRHQLLTLERRTARSGKDSVDHRPGARDDVANAACGAVALAVERQSTNVAPIGIPKVTAATMDPTLISATDFPTGRRGRWDMGNYG